MPIVARGFTLDRTYIYIGREGTFRQCYTSWKEGMNNSNAIQKRKWIIQNAFLEERADLFHRGTIQPECVLSFLISKNCAEYIPCTTNYSCMWWNFFPFQLHKFDIAGRMWQIFYVIQAKRFCLKLPIYHMLTPDNILEGLPKIRHLHAS